MPLAVWLLNLTTFVYWAIVVIFIIAIVSGSVLIALFTWMRYEQAMEQRAKRKQADNMVVTAPEGHQVYFYERHHDTVRPLHLMPGYSNSRPMHTDEDERRWLAYQATRKPSVINSTAKLLPANTEDQQVNHFYELLDIYPHLMLIAPSGSGKSTQISLAANYLLQQKPQSKLIWMSTHALEDKQLIHPKAVIIQNVDDIVLRLNEIVRIYRTRRDNPKKNYTQLIVVLDEWYDLIMSDGDIKDAIAQLSSEARKFGIILILASHTDNVSDTGINRNLRRNFGRVRLDANLTKQGKAIWMKYDKQDSWAEIELPKRREMAQQLVNCGMSKNQAAITVYNRGYGGDLASKF